MSTGGTVAEFGGVVGGVVGIGAQVTGTEVAGAEVAGAGVLAPCPVSCSGSVSCGSDSCWRT